MSFDRYHRIRYKGRDNLIHDIPLYTESADVSRRYHHYFCTKVSNGIRYAKTNTGNVTGMNFCELVKNELNVSGLSEEMPIITLTFSFSQSAPTSGETLYTTKLTGISSTCRFAENYKVRLEKGSVYQEYTFTAGDISVTGNPLASVSLSTKQTSNASKTTIILYGSTTQNPSMHAISDGVWSINHGQTNLTYTVSYTEVAPK